jgi:phosphoglycerate dehydrogenase-like enzyme
MVKLDKWSQRYSLELDDMTEKTLGIVGFGRIGQHLAGLAAPFGMRVVAHDPFVDKKLASARNVELLDLESLLKTSDYVSLHPALNDSSRGLIKSEHMEVIKKGAILINASRGGVVENLEILADALDEGVLSGVALDVFPEEPPVYPHRIFEHPMCLCAPHMAGLSKLAMLRILKSMANDMLAVVGGNMPKYCVNPEVLNK